MEKEEKKIETKKDVIKPKKVKKNSNAKTVIASIIALFVGAAAMYLLVYFVLPVGEGNTVINRSEKEVTVTDKGIADAVDKLYDAVVVVEVYNNNDVLTSSGTGFVYKTEGDTSYILTNNHVVNGASKVKVIFTNDKEVDVKVEGADVYSDLAVLSLKSSEIISVAEIGTSDDMRLGDTVFTIGAPLDTEYYWTVTRGVLSGKNRMVEVSSSNSAQTSADFVIKVLQTDASINSGNSGGPLANSNGQVIGITNMKLVSSGVEGIGFAIPIEDAVEFAETIIAGDSIKRPLLGVSMLPLADKRSLYQEGITLNTELTSGVVIVKTQDGSPADKGGLVRGDIITAIDDDKTTYVAQLRYYLYKHSVGDTVTITYERAGKTDTTRIKLTVASE